MKIICIANQKGGVGKSIISANLTHWLVEQGRRVLLVDSDVEQCHASRGLNAHAMSCGASALFDANIPLDAPTGDLMVLRGDSGLRAVERSDLDDGALVAVLRERFAQVADDYDYCVIDTAGSNSRVANALLVASNFVLVPCMLDPLSIDVATTMLQRIAFIQHEWNTRLVNLGILPNGFDAGVPAQTEWLGQLVVAYKGYMFPGYISMRSAYKEVSDLGIPVWKLRADDKKDGNKGRIKTTAREAGDEIKLIFGVMLKQMESQ